MKLAAAAGRRAAHRLFGTGLVPAVGYGAEITGFSDPEIRRVQAIGLRTVTPSNRGASRVARLALERGVATDALASAALFRLAKEVWASLHASPVAFSLGDLAVAWSILADFSGTWRSAAGPLHIAHCSARNVARWMGS